MVSSCLLCIYYYATVYGVLVLAVTRSEQGQEEVL